MFMRKIVISVAVSAAALQIIGCSGSDGTERAEGAEAAAEVCDVVCRRILDCNPRTDADICANDCEGLADELSVIRSDVVRSTMGCFDAVECSEVRNAEGLTSCLEESIALVTPSATAVRFCQELEASMIGCDSDASVDRAACLESTKHYADSILEKAIACTDKPCDVGPRCIASTLGLAE